MEFRIRKDEDLSPIIEYLCNLDVSQSEYTVKVTKRAEKRTLSQNRLYRLWLNCISAETGNDVEDLHEYFKMEFLGVYSRIIYGKEVARGYTTTDLTTEQFKAYLDNIQRWASVEQGIILPDPESLQWEQFLNKYDK
jgi:hypothetical protein